MYCETKSLYTDERWEEIRVLARKLITSMAWQYHKPLKNGFTYVSNNQSKKNA